MLLKDYLKKTGMKPYVFAELAGINREAVYRKNRRVSVQTAEKIEKATKGQVTRMEALWPEYYEEKVEDSAEQYKFRFE